MSKPPTASSRTARTSDSGSGENEIEFKKLELGITPSKMKGQEK